MSAQPPPPAPAEELNLRVATRADVSGALAQLEGLRREFSTVAPSTASPRFSFKGWSLQAWLARNAGFVKTTLTGASTVTGAVAVTDVATLRSVLIVWGIAAFAIGFRAGLDAVHYFISEQTGA